MSSVNLPYKDTTTVVETPLPQYYREGYFSADTLLHPELPGGRYGVAGDPVPYTMYGDHIITSLLLLSFVIAVISISNARNFLMRQAKNFFYLSHGSTTEIMETATEMRLQFFLVLQCCIMVALLFYFYTLNNIGETFVLDSPYLLIAIFLAMIIAYFIGKALLYALVNGIFFGSKKSKQWITSMLFITSFEGVLLFPAVLMFMFLGMTTRDVVIYFIIALFLVKMLTFYKCYVTFFRRNEFKLQIILYLCTLEIVPLLAFWGALVTTANNLKINF